MSVKYPTRARILDVTGQSIPAGDHLIGIRTPEESMPFIGKEGLAERLRNGDVRITLDDGHVLWGWECWWQPVPA